MSVTLHLFFAGLIAFVPSQDGRELTVLVPDAGHGHVISDGSRIEPHRTLLVARAADCRGDCGAMDAGIDALLFADQPAAKMPGELSDAIRQGAAWRLDGVDLSISQAGPLDIRPNFSSVAALGRILPGAGVVDPALLGPTPPAGRIAARLRLHSGAISTYRLVDLVDGGVPSLRFRTLKDGRDAAPCYTQPLATWVMAEIKLPGDAVDVVAEAFGKDEKRSIQLSPDDRGIVEIVVMSVVAKRSNQEADGLDKHFEIYYGLLKEKPALLPIPYVAEKSGSPGLVAPEPSELLEALRLSDPRGVYDRLICPLAQLQADPNP